MKLVGSILAVLLISTSSYASDVKTIKNWFVGLGPAFSDSLVAVTADRTGVSRPNGTNFAVILQHWFGMAEYWDWFISYDASFNSASAGISQLATVGGGIKYWLRDRGAENSLWVAGGLGYGGSNRNIEASYSPSIAIGFDFFRKNDVAFDVQLRRAYIITTGTNQALVSNNPYVTQLLFGVNF